MSTGVPTEPAAYDMRAATAPLMSHGFNRIENRTFDELQPGDTASLVRTLTYEDIELFAIMSGDVNPAHVDEAFAKSDMFHKVVAHGMWGGANLDGAGYATARTGHDLRR